MGRPVLLLIVNVLRLMKNELAIAAAVSFEKNLTVLERLQMAS